MITETAISRTPKVERATGTHYFIAPNDPALDELVNDAEHYAEGGVACEPELIGLIASARATLRSIRKARQEMPK